MMCIWIKYLQEFIPINIYLVSIPYHILCIFCAYTMHLPSITVLCSCQNCCLVLAPSILQDIFLDNDAHMNAYTSSTIRLSGIQVCFISKMCIFFLSHFATSIYVATISFLPLMYRKKLDREWIKNPFGLEQLRM